MPRIHQYKFNPQIARVDSPVKTPTHTQIQQEADASLVNPNQRQYSIKDFVSEVNSTFNLNFLSSQRLPINLGEFNMSGFPDLRLNHYLVKSNDSDDFVFGKIDHPNIQNLIVSLYIKLESMGINVRNRYCFVTIDQGYIESGKTLRDPGWHIDGLQGDEVPKKVPADVQVIWFDALPTRFSKQPFNVNGLDSSRHNVFEWLDRQIHPSGEINTQASHLYAMNPYHVHRALHANETTYRRFLRISFTYTPVTSNRMTINPFMHYNYSIHATNGNPPLYLEVIPKVKDKQPPY